MLKKGFGVRASSLPAEVETVGPETAPVTKTQARGLNLGNHPVFLALLGSLALAAIYGRVALLNLTTGLVGGDLDGYENLWNNYWVKTALFKLRNPFFTDYIYYPTGTSLRFHTLNPFNGLLTLPFNLTLGWVPTTNLLFVLALAFTTFFGFLLLRDLVGNSWAAFGGTALFTYANYQVIGFFSFGQAEKLSAEWYPLYLFFMFRTLHGPPANLAKADYIPSNEIAASETKPPAGIWGMGRWRLYLALSVVTLVILSLTDWQYLIYAIFTTLLYFAFMLCTRRSWREKRLIFLKLAAIGGIYAALVLVPLVLPMLKEVSTSPWLSVSEQSVYHSLDVLDLVKPGWFGSEEGGGLSNLDAPRAGLGNPGYLALVVGLVGLWLVWKKRGHAREIGLFWTIAAGIACILALGPRLKFNGQLTDLPLPYEIFYKLPVLSTGRDPARFYTIAMLGFGVLTAFGLRAIFERFPSLLNFKRFWGRERLLVASITAVFLAVTLGGFVAEAGKAPVYPPDWPPFYEQLAKDQETYAILELPLFTERGRGEDTYEAYQSLHNKKRFAGRLARDHKLTNPDNFVKKASLFRELWLTNLKDKDQQFFYPAQDFLTRTDYRAQGLSILNYYDVRYIVLYKDAITTSQWNRFKEILAQILGQNVAPFYEDRLMFVYQVPKAKALPANPFTLDPGYGWSASQSEGGRTYRWADSTNNQPSELYTMNLAPQPTKATLNLKLFAFKQPRTVKISINGYEAASIQLNPDEAEKAVSLDLTLPFGNNLITLSTPEAPLPTGDPLDGRLLSFGASNVSITPK